MCWFLLCNKSMCAPHSKQFSFHTTDLQLNFALQEGKFLLLLSISEALTRVQHTFACILLALARIWPINCSCETHRRPSTCLLILALKMSFASPWIVISRLHFFTSCIFWSISLWSGPIRILSLVQRRHNILPL